MKSIVLLLSVSACAYGAPSRFMERDSLVPEVAVVQTQDQMDALKAEFEQVKSLAASGKTNGIEATIDKMIGMIEGEDGLETMIKDAHATDQTTLNTDMAAIGTHNSAFVTEEAALQQDGNNVRKLIDDEQAKSQTWEAQAGAFTSSQSVFLGAFTKQTNACCKRDQAAVMSVEYVPSYAECDYKIQSTSGGCAERAKNDVNDVVSSPFTEGLTRYRNLARSVMMTQPPSTAPSLTQPINSVSVARTRPPPSLPPTLRLRNRPGCRVSGTLLPRSTRALTTACTPPTPRRKQGSKRTTRTAPRSGAPCRRSR